MDYESSYEETVEKYEKMDRIRKIKKTSIITLFAVMLVTLIIYAASIERKITELAQAQAIAVYKADETTVSVDSSVPYVDNSNAESGVETIDKTGQIEEASTTQTCTVDAGSEYEITTSQATVEGSETQVTTQEETFASETHSEISATEEFREESTVSQIHDSDSNSKIYYVTKTGKKYHNAGCSYLKSKIEITYGEILKGGYEPCSRCIK